MDPNPIADTRLREIALGHAVDHSTSIENADEVVAMAEKFHAFLSGA